VIFEKGDLTISILRSYSSDYDFAIGVGWDDPNIKRRW
jgi:hypothetical protein